MAKILELTGLITGKLAYKVYKKNAFYGQTNYKLTVLEEQNQQKLILLVYANLASPEVLRVIQQSQYINKQYHLFCQRLGRNLILTNWQEITGKLTTYD